MREVLRCEHCSLVQFRTSNSMCRRCHKALDAEEPVAVISSLSSMEPGETSDDAGFRVATLVKEVRKARHLSQRQLASRMQVPRTYISKIENGKAMPTLGSLERLAEALEVNICQLVRDGRSRRLEEVSQILADPFLAELAQFLPGLEPIHRSMLLNQARDLVRDLVREQAREQARGAARLQAVGKLRTA